MSEPTLSRTSIGVYGSLGVPLALLGYPLGIWLPLAYTAYAGVPAEIVGAIISATAIFDAVTDPMVGFASDRVRTRYGRRRAWLAMGVPVLFVALWYILNPTPDPAAGSGAAGSASGSGAPSLGNAVYLAAWFIVLRLGTTLVLVPYAAWGAELSGEYHTRTRIVAARQVGVLVGLIGAALVPVFVEETLGDEATPLRVLGAYTIPVLLLLPATAALVIARVPEPPASIREGQTSFLESMRLIAKNRLFVRILTIALLIEGGEAFRNALSLLFIRDYIGAPRAGWLYLVYFGMGLLAIPLWNRLARQSGKHRSLSAAIITVGAISITIFMLDVGTVSWLLGAFGSSSEAVTPESIKRTQVIAFYALFALKGFCFGAYFSIHGFMEKVAQSFGGFSLIVLASIGYDTTPGVPHDRFDLVWLGSLYAIVPTIAFAVALVFCWTWPMTSERHAKLQRLIVRRSARRAAMSPAPTASAER